MNDDKFAPACGSPPPPRKCSTKILQVCEQSQGAIIENVPDISQREELSLLQTLT